MDELSGRLVVVATPIGNLGDISERARRELEHADVICCEDTRRTRALLSALHLAAGRRLVSVHEHNERSKAQWVVTKVRDGARVCYVTDAGTPGVSDPGSLLVREVAAAGLEVTTVPGPSAAVAALVVSGLPMDRFCVEGFLPRQASDRERRLAALANEERTTVIFEAANRLAATFAELERTLGERPCVVCRELTKLHEEVVRGTVGSLAERYRSGDVPRGEVVVVLGGSTRATASDDEVARAVRDELAHGASVRDAAASVASRLEVSKRRAYEAALRAGTGDAS